MHLKKSIVWAGCIVLAASMVLPFVSNDMAAYAETLKEKKEKSEAELSGYKENLGSLEGEIADTVAKIEEKKGKVTETNTKIEEAIIDYNEELEKIDDQANLEYELSGMQMLTRLLVMPSMAQLDEYESYLDHIDGSYDGEREKSQEKLDAVMELEAQLEMELSELQALQQEQAIQKQELEQNIQDTQERVDDLAEQIKKEEARKKSKPAASGQYTYDGTSYTYGQSDMELIYAIVMQEGGGSYESALAVITSACNRAVSRQWSYLGSDPLSQLTARGQYCYSIDSHWKKYLGGNVNDNVKRAVADALSGKRNHNCLSFRGYRVAGGINIGGNYYFNSL